MTEDEIEKAFDAWLANEQGRLADDEPDMNSDLFGHAYYDCCLWLGWRAAYGALGAVDTEPNKPMWNSSVTYFQRPPEPETRCYWLAGTRVHVKPFCRCNARGPRPSWF